MEQKAKNSLDKAGYDPVLFTSYTITKKILKYSLYGMIIYFACKGFMTWE